MKHLYLNPKHLGIAPINPRLTQSAMPLEKKTIKEKLNEVFYMVLCFFNR